MAINKTLLRKVRNHILAEPRRYDQGEVASEVSRRKSPCGTRACIGGWADILEDDDVKDLSDVSLGRAQKKLGFTDEQANIVFFGGGPDWPEEFEKAWRNDIPRKEAARLAADYINYIIRTGRVT